VQGINLNRGGAPDKGDGGTAGRRAASQPTTHSMAVDQERGPAPLGDIPRALIRSQSSVPASVLNVTATAGTGDPSRTLGPKSADLLRSQLRQIKPFNPSVGVADTPADTTNAGKRPRSAGSSTQAEKKRMEIGQAGASPTLAKTAAEPRISHTNISTSTPSATPNSSTPEPSPASVTPMPSAAKETTTEQHTPSPPMGTWCSVDIGYRATERSGTRMQGELVRSNLPSSVKERIADLDQGTLEEQRHRKNSEQLNKSRMQSCWMSTNMPIEGFSLAHNSPSQDSECPMCVQRRSDGGEVACFYLTSSKLIRVFVINE
jgi:hypothetical protein